MWKGFEFNKPYDGVIPDKINGVELPIICALTLWRKVYESAVVLL